MRIYTTKDRDGIWFRAHVWQGLYHGRFSLFVYDPDSVMHTIKDVPQGCRLVWNPATDRSRVIPESQIGIWVSRGFQRLMALM